TLTSGRPRLTSSTAGDPKAYAIAAAMAARSSHPVSRAIAALAQDPTLDVIDLREYPGLGLSATVEGEVYRLGQAEWCGDQQSGQTVLSRDGKRLAAFMLEDSLRRGAGQAAQ